MASAAHSFEADLRAVREAAGLTIEDVHHATRLAKDIIQRFESGQLVGDPSFNAVYLKAFARSYGEAVGLRPHIVQAAWEAAVDGAYHGELHPDFAKSRDGIPEEVLGASDAVSATEDEAVVPQKESRFSKVDPLPPAIVVGSAAFPVPSTTTYTGAKPTRRLQQKARPSSGKAFDSAWGAILGVTVVIVVAVLTILWLLFRGDAPEPDVATSSGPESVESTEVESLVVGGPMDQAAAPRLAFPIEVSVVVGGNGLQNFKVTEAPSERQPIWVEPGETVSFSSDQSVVLWGEAASGLNPDEVTLRFQGYEWKPPQGQVLRIDREYGQTLLDSLHAVFPRGGQITSQP